MKSRREAISFVRGTRAAVGVEDGVVRMWDVVWNSEEERFDEAAMKDSVRVHHVHVKNGVRKQIDGDAIICIKHALFLSLLESLFTAMSLGRFTYSWLSCMLSRKAQSNCSSSVMMLMSTVG